MQSVLSGSLIFSKNDLELSRIAPGPDAVTVTGSLHITGSRLTLNGSDLELRISTLEGSTIGDLNIAGVLLHTGSTNEWTASIKNYTGSLVTTSSFNTLTGSVSNLTSQTGSYIDSGSITGSILQLHRVSGDTLDINIPSGIDTLPGGIVSSSSQIAELGFVTGSPVMSASYQDGVLSFTSYDPSQSFSVTIGTGSQGSGSINTGSFVTTSSFSTFTSSVDDLTKVTGSYVISGSVSGSNLQLHTVSGSILTISLPTQSTSSIDSITGSLNNLTSNTGSYLISGSTSGSILKLHTVSGSVFEINLPQGGGTGSIDTGSFVTTSSFNTFTSSVDRLTSQTGSYLNSGSKTGTVLSLYQQDGGRFDFDLGSSDTTFNGNRVVSNQLLPSLYSASFNAGTTGSIQEFLEAIFFPNLSPDFTFTPTGLDSTNAITSSKIAEVVVTDGDSSTPFDFNISGPDSNLFYIIPQNSISSSWFVYVTGSVTDDISGSFTNGILNEQIFDLTGSAIDQFNGITTKPIELEVTQPTNQGYVYLYQTDTSRGGTSYNLYMGITAEENGPPPSASLTTLYTTTFTEIASGALGQSVIGPFYGGTTNAHLIGSLRSGSNLPDMVAQATYTTPNRIGHYLLVASSGSALTGLPTSMRGSFGGSTAGEYVGCFDFGGGFGISGTTVHEISLQTPHLGYTDWFVIGNLQPAATTTIKYRLVPSSGSLPIS